MNTTVYHTGLVVRTKLAPPRPHKHTLHRPRLTRRLLQALDHRLTIVQAGAGYGKSTALTALANAGYPLVWYHLGAEDADPLLFLLHLLHGFAGTLPGLADTSLAMLEEWERNGRAFSWSGVIDALVNDLAGQNSEPLFLILDDVHLLNKAAEPIRILNRLIGLAPPTLNIILSTRYPLKLPNLVTWRVKGELLEIGQEELAFTPAEIGTLFRNHYGLTLTPEQVSILATEIEGWAIALHLVWQRLQNDEATLSDALQQLSVSSGDLFAYLAQEVLKQQPPDIRTFLLTTSVLRELTAATCNYLRAASDSDQIIRYLLENDLFIVDLGNGHVRYHHLFRDLLRHQLAEEEAHAAHRKAAACFRERGQEQEAIYHLLEAKAFDEAAVILDRVGQGLVRAGRLDTLSAWISALPPEILENHPLLLIYLGDIARLRSHFKEALGWYEQAEERNRLRGDIRGMGKALRGQARVYLDTVNPSQAERLLQEALRLSDRQEDRESRARLLELLAENLLNQGRSEEAAQYQAQVRELREEGPGKAELAVRMLLRTGQLDQARHQLEKRAEAERREPVLRPRAHRETLLLLSLVLAFQGKQEEAYRCAVEGTERGEALDSHFITAVGQMRQGHAWLLHKNERGYEEARHCFQEAITLSETLMVPRLKVEACWGLCQSYGFRGDLEMAQQTAEQGIAIARAAGDEWVEGCIRAAMGASYALAGHYREAAEWLAQTDTIYRECGDTYGETITRLWQCLVWYHTDDVPRLERDVESLLRLVRHHRYDYIFKRKTLLGPPDPRSLVPLLLFARDNGRQSPYAERILSQLGLGRLELHPGYRLQVHTLGVFQVWRGRDEVTTKAWRRKKARQLFQFFLTYRHHMLERDQIIDMLWPDLTPEGGQRDFKIAYSTLCRVLEPQRGRGAPSAYVLRDGTLYGLRPEADLWLDVEAFEHLIAQGDQLFDEDRQAALDHYRQALVLYQGEYLAECRYDEWCSEERERLLTLYLQTADRLAHALVEQSDWEEAIKVCQSILVQDNCWEQAYRIMMTGYVHLGHRTQALRTYRRCVNALQKELGVAPTTATTHLYQNLTQQQPERMINDER